LRGSTWTVTFSTYIVARAHAGASIPFIPKKGKNSTCQKKSGVAKAAPPFSRHTGLTASDGLALWDYPSISTWDCHTCVWVSMPICLPPFLLCKHRTGTYRSSHHNFTHPLPDINTLSKLNHPQIIAPSQWLNYFISCFIRKSTAKCLEVPVSYIVFN